MLLGAPHSGTARRAFPFPSGPQPDPTATGLGHGSSRLVSHPHRRFLPRCLHHARRSQRPGRREPNWNVLRARRRGRWPVLLGHCDVSVGDGRTGGHAASRAPFRSSVLTEPFAAIVEVVDGGPTHIAASMARHVRVQPNSRPPGPTNCSTPAPRFPTSTLLRRRRHGRRRPTLPVVQGRGARTAAGATSVTRSRTKASAWRSSSTDLSPSWPAGASWRTPTYSRDATRGRYGGFETDCCPPTDCRLPYPVQCRNLSTARRPANVNRSCP